MLARMHAVLRTLGGKIEVSAVDWVSKLSAGEQTRLTWAKALTSYEAIPDGYKEFFETQLAAGQAFPYTIYTPVFETLGYKITEKLVCVLADEIYVLEKNGAALAVECFPPTGISQVEVSSLLLDSRIKISGVNKQGVSTSAIIRFNSSTSQLFTPLLKKMRCAKVNITEEVRASELHKFDRWLMPNFKFMNFGKNSLQGGETVLQLLLQPEIKRRRFRILSKTYYRTLAPTHAVILTDRELILIREQLLQNRKDNYGGIWNYIPLEQIAQLTAHPAEHDLWALTIKLHTSEPLEFLFQAELKAELDQLLAQFSGIRPTH